MVDQQNHRKFLVAGFAAMVAACVARFWNLTLRPLDFDEVYEVTHHSRSLAEMLPLIDGMPPTFGFLLSHWIHWLGSDISSRWFVALLGVATVAAIGALGYQLAGRSVSVFAMWFAALSPWHIYHSQSVRVYSLYCFVTTMMLFCGFRLFRNSLWQNWALFVIASWLACATHYYAAVPVFCMWLLVWYFTPPKYWHRGFLSGAALALSLTPVANALTFDLQPPGTYWKKVFFQFEDLAYTYFCLFGGYTLGPPIEELRQISLSRGFIRTLPAALAVAAALTPIMISVVFGKHRRQTVLALAFLLIVPVLFLGVVTYWSATGFVYRYVIWIVAPASVLLAIGISQMPRLRWRIACCGAMCVLSFVSLFKMHYDQRYQRDDFRSAVAIVNDEPILAMPLYFASAAEYHFGKSNRVFAASALPGQPQNWKKAVSDLREELKDGSGCFILVKWYPDSDPRSAICNQLLMTLNAEFVVRITTFDIYKTSAKNVNEACQILP